MIQQLLSTLLLWGALVSSLFAKEPLRTWTSINGRKIEAKLLWADDSNIYVRDKKNAKKHTISLKNLSKIDLLYINAFKEEMKEAGVLYQFELIGEHFRKKQLGSIREQKAGSYFVDGNQGKGTLSWSFTASAPLPPELLSRSVRLQVSLGTTKYAGTNGQVRIYKNSTLVSERAGLKKGKRHHFDIPFDQIFKLSPPPNADRKTDLTISVKNQDGILVLGRNSSAPPTLRIYKKK